MSTMSSDFDDVPDIGEEEKENKRGNQYIPIQHLDTAVQGAIHAKDPQAAVTALVKRYAAQMAGDIVAVLKEWGAT